MQITCPSCYARYSIDVAINDADARQAIKAALDLPGELGPLVLRYLGCFNPPKKSLQWKRVATLLADLNAAVDSQTVNRHGRDWRVTVPIWRAALQATLDNRDAGKLTLPLKDNAYLFAIAQDMANSEEAAAEKQREQQHRDSGREQRSGGFNAATNLINSPEYRRKVNEQLGLEGND